MKLQKPTWRMTMRELLTHADRQTRELVQRLRADTLADAADFRQLSRPVRRRSQYPTVQALQNAVGKFEGSAEDALVLVKDYLEQLRCLRDKARQEERRGSAPYREREIA
jgi:hypothetical protein